MAPTTRSTPGAAFPECVARSRWGLWLGLIDVIWSFRVGCDGPATRIGADGAHDGETRIWRWGRNHSP